MTKEEIQKELAEQCYKANTLSEKDENVREEFAKAFDWYKKDYSYSEETVKTPSWEEIFVKIGALLNAEGKLRTKQILEGIENRIHLLEFPPKSKKENDL